MSQSSNVLNNDQSDNYSSSLVNETCDDDVALFKSCNGKSLKIAKENKPSNSSILNFLLGHEAKDNKKDEIVDNNHNSFNMFINKDRKRQRFNDVILITKDQ